MRDDTGTQARMGLIELAVILVSTAMLMFQIQQTIIMSLQALEKNAFLVVSLCLLGLGSGGSIVTWLTRKRQLDSGTVLRTCALAFGILLVVMTALSSRVLALPALIVLGVVPYVFVGVFLAVIFQSWPQRANRLYFFNLVGSGIGCLALVGLIGATGDATLALIIIGAISVLGAIAVDVAYGVRRPVQPVVVLIGLMALIPIRHQLYDFKPAARKGMARIINDPRIESSVDWSRWGYLGRLDVVRPGKGIENFARGGGRVSDQLAAGLAVRYLFASGGNWTEAVDFTGNTAARDTFVTTSRHGMPYTLAGEAPDVLNIGFGGGVDIFLALAFGAKSVVGVEINPLMIKAGREHLAGYYDDFYNDPRVTIYEMDGRAYVRGTDRRFDTVSLTEVDTGELLHSHAQVLSENYLYTREAFADYMRVLKPGGFLYVSRPHIQTMRTLATGLEALRNIGIADPERHFVVLGQGKGGKAGWRSVLISKRSLSDDDIRVLEAKYDNDIAYSPLHPERDETYANLFRRVSNDEEHIYFEKWEVDFTPVSDDRPFFYEYGRGLTDSVGSRILLKVLAWVTLIAAVMILLPMFAARGTGPRRPAAGIFGYFTAIGLGFMFVEIGMIQKLTLFLGHPSYSVTVTLFSILVFSGLGSITAARFDIARRTAWIIWPPILIATLFYALGLGAVIGAIQTDSIVARVIIAALLLAPGSFFMGMPFPTFVRSMRGEDTALIPWGWAINSFTSVAASVLTVLFAMRFGFTAVMFLGAAAYISALVLFLHRVGRSRVAAP
jgi:SAM-dependent methyltransferase